MRRGRPPEQHIPDPSATIPDFGPRPDIDQAKLDEIRKLIPPPTEEEPLPSPQGSPQREPATPPASAPISAAGQGKPEVKKKSNFWLFVGIGVVLAILAALIGFVTVTGFGLIAVFMTR